MVQFEANKKRFLNLITHWHKGHPSEDQVQHCINVMQWLEMALDTEKGSIPGMASTHDTPAGTYSGVLRQG